MPFQKYLFTQKGATPQSLARSLLQKVYTSDFNNIVFSVHKL